MHCDLIYMYFNMYVCIYLLPQWFKAFEEIMTLRTVKLARYAIVNVVDVLSTFPLFATSI